MMINPIFMPYCENCDRADLSLEELPCVGLHISGGSTWHAKCSHEDACRRIARLVEENTIDISDYVKATGKTIDEIRAEIDQEHIDEDYVKARTEEKKLHEALAKAILFGD